MELAPCHKLLLLREKDSLHQSRHLPSSFPGRLWPEVFAFAIDCRPHRTDNPCSGGSSEGWDTLTARTQLRCCCCFQPTLLPPGGQRTPEPTHPGTLQGTLTLTEWGHSFQNASTAGMGLESKEVLCGRRQPQLARELIPRSRGEWTLWARMPLGRSRTWRQFLQLLQTQDSVLHQQ